LKASPCSGRPVQRRAARVAEGPADADVSYTTQARAEGAGEAQGEELALIGPLPQWRREAVDAGFVLL